MKKIFISQIPVTVLKTLCLTFKKLRYTFALVILVLALQVAQAQKFTIDLPKEKISNSLYNQIGMYDARKDTLNLGILRFYANGSPSYVLAEPSLTTQIQDVFKAFVDTSAATEVLLFHLREFSFASHASFLGETGYCTIRAGMYVRHSKGVYQLLATLDTSFVKKKLGAKNALFNSADHIFKSFIANNLKKSPTDTTVYSTADIKYIESREKKVLPLYNTDTLKDGMYKTYASFAKQIPDKKVIVKLEDDDVKSVKVENSSGEIVEINPSSIYALVYQGKGYIATEFGYYPITKKKDDFYYSGKAKAVGNGAHVANSQFNYGIIGGLLAANENGMYEIKIDHLNGNPIKTKRLDTR